MKKYLTLLALAVAVPQYVLAQSPTTPKSSPFQTFIGKVQDNILTPIITLLALAAFVIFIWGVLEFIAGSDNEEKRKAGQQHMIWGIIGLVIIFGANAIVSLMKATVGG